MAISTAVAPAGAPHPDSASLRTLGFAFGASLVLHWLVVAVPHWRPPPIADAGPLVVRLTPPPPPVALPATSPAPDPVTSPDPPVPPAMREQPPAPKRERDESSRAPRPARSMVPPAPPPAPAPAPARHTAPTPLPQRDLEAIYDRLAQDDLLYPEEAAKRGLGGEVLLVVDLGADGRVLDASVATSSGHRILDDAAVRAVRRLGVLGAAHAGKSFLLTIRFLP